MVKYSVKAIESLLGPIWKIQGRPQFKILYQLSQQLTEHLRKINHPIYQYDVFAGYMMSAASYALFSTTVWMDPVNVGELFVVPVTSITYTKQNEHKIM